MEGLLLGPEVGIDVVGLKLGEKVTGDAVGLPTILGLLDGPALGDFVGLGVGGSVGGGQSLLLETHENDPSYDLQHTGVAP